MANSVCKVWAGFAIVSFFWFGQSALKAPESFPVVTVINMKRDPTSKPSVFSPDQIDSAIASAPDRMDDPACPYDPNDADAVATYWAKGKVHLPGQRGTQKRPTKVAVTVRYSPEVVAYFKSTGEGWHTRMNDALREYVAQHRAV